MMIVHCSFVLLLVQLLTVSSDVNGFVYFCVTPWDDYYEGISNEQLPGRGMMYRHHRETVRQQQIDHALECLKERGNTFQPTEEYIVQPLDHFDAQNKKTYSQRYYANSESWKKPDGPIILDIAGEWTMDLHWTDVTRCAGNSYVYPDDALVFSIEHRFYGKSINQDGLLLENLRYLSSEQDLADLAVFRQAMTAKYNLTGSNKWIATGGSYAGSLAAWVRIKYPHLFHAAVASSAPVRAVVDFTGYNDVVARSYGQPLIHGSDKCVAAIKDAFQTVDSLIQQGKLEKLANDFHSCKPLQTELDVNVLVTHLADHFMGSAQYMGDYQHGLSKDCEMMTDSSATAYQNLVRLFSGATLKEGCADYSWENFVSWLLQTDALNNDRPWIYHYQTCTEFGYYQTCEPNSSCLFSRHMDLKPYLLLCQILFNTTTQQVYDRVDFTNTYYGSDNPQGSRIIFVNGLIDPWHSLSVLKDLSSSELAIVIPQTAHCADMDYPTIYDPPALTAARQKIRQQVEAWLKE